VNVGERVVVAEVIRDEGGWVDVLIRDCTIGSEKPGHKVLPLAKNGALRRKRHTIEKGKPEGLLWSDETVRASLVSRLLGGIIRPRPKRRRRDRAGPGFGDGRSAPTHGGLRDREARTQRAETQG